MGFIVGEWVLVWWVGWCVGWFVLAYVSDITAEGADYSDQLPP